MLTELLLKSSSAVCSEFSRKPRSLREVEFRNFLSYLGPVVLQSVFHDNWHHHFMLMSVAITVMLHPILSQTMLSFVTKLLGSFVSETCRLYRHESLVCNMLNLVHLPDVVALLGTLDKFSCFQFEGCYVWVFVHLHSFVDDILNCHHSSLQPVMCNKRQPVKTNSGIYSVGEEHTSQLFCRD